MTAQIRTQSKKRNSEKSRLPEILNRAVAAYAMAAGMAGVSVAATTGTATEPTQGPIVFTPTHVFLGGIGSEHLNLDLNHDGVTDITLIMTNTLYIQTSMAFTVEGGQFRDDPAAGAAAMLSPLAENSGIGSAGKFASNKEILAWGRIVAHSGHSGYSIRGPWDKAATNSYLGVRFQIDGETHYGWIRMTVVTAVYEVYATVTGYAYNTLPNQPIRAGEGATQSASAIPRPASLGMLSLGAAGLPLWRKQE